MSGGKQVRLTLRVEDFPFKEPFRISGHVFDRTQVLVAELDDGTHRGRGEGAGVYYLGDDLDHMVAQAESVRPSIEAGATRADLQSLLPAGGAQNAPSTSSTCRNSTITIMISTLSTHSRHSALKREIGRAHV